jgi:hypothetical protein
MDFNFSRKTLIFWLNAFSVSEDADPPEVQFKVMLPAGRDAVLGVRQN